jgi:D-3-phosphoglycerate dehydrogenase / 2-oxoglutarate reductase
MKIVISDDYQDAVRGLACFAKLAGHEVVIHHDTLTDEDALAARFAEAEAIVLIRERTRMTASLLARLPKLKVISQTGRLGPSVDVDAARKHGVTVLEGSGTSWAPAELTWALLLASARRIVVEANATRAGRWQTTLGTGLRGRTLGIWGWGRIGKLVAGYGRAFEMQVLVATRQDVEAPGIRFTKDPRALLRAADFATLHLQLRPETRGIVTPELLAEMKPTAHLINTSRAALIAPGALEAALRAGRPGFAALDVFDQEPLKGDEPLLSLPNVLATPHLGYVEEDSYEAYFAQAFENLVTWSEPKT